MLLLKKVAMVRAFCKLPHFSFTPLFHCGRARGKEGSGGSEGRGPGGKLPGKPDGIGIGAGSIGEGVTEGSSEPPGVRRWALSQLRSTSGFT